MMLKFVFEKVINQKLVLDYFMVDVVDPRYRKKVSTKPTTGFEIDKKNLLMEVLNDADGTRYFSSRSIRELYEEGNLGEYSIHNVSNCSNITTALNGISLAFYKKNSKDFSLHYLPFLFLVDHIKKYNPNKFTNANFKKLIKFLVSLIFTEIVNESLSSTVKDEAVESISIFTNIITLFMQELGGALVTTENGERGQGFRTVKVILENASYDELVRLISILKNKEIELHSFTQSLPTVYSVTSMFQILSYSPRLQKNLGDHFIRKLEREFDLRELQLLLSYNCYYKDTPLSKIIRERVQEISRENFKIFFERLMTVVESYSRENILRLLPYLNFSSIFRLQTIEERLVKVNQISNAIAMKIKTGGRGSIVESPDRPIISKYLKTVDLSSFSTVERYTGKVFFTKDAPLSSMLGDKTGCCFRVGAVGEPYLKSSVSCPLAGNILSYRKELWFSYVWEYVYFNNETGHFELHLVLDNVESFKPQDYQTVIQEFLDTIIIRNNIYSKVFLGTLRNDISGIPQSIVDTATYRLAKLKGMKHQGFDDSENVYKIADNPISIDSDSTVYLKNMDKRDLILSKYVEETVYNVEDPDWMDYVKSFIPDVSFIWSNNKIIVGYFLVSDIPKYMIRDMESNMMIKMEHADKDVIVTMKDINGIEFTTSLEKCITISDLYLQESENQPELVKSLSVVFKKLEEYIVEKGIVAVEVNPNNNSKNFIKRLEGKGIRIFNTTNTPFDCKQLKAPEQKFKVSFELLQ